uniref:Potassium channel domain-containing protein n=1 Tax=Denticeps clupeoides TaxID=299321 RepID=A0AAY4A471_9TELE
MSWSLMHLGTLVTPDLMTETRPACVSCYLLRDMNQDNARFGLLAALILLYLLCGAAVFSALERPSELQARHRWAEQLDNFTRQHHIQMDALRVLLRQYEEANVAGIRLHGFRPRWDFSGAFYFVGTVVSTIGFGMTTPATIAGKMFLIFYGLIGCAATILFFNLFLERIITMLAYIMRWCHERQLRHSGIGRDNSRSEDDSLEGWKPSVYYVMLILGVAAVLIACSASALYSTMEDWDYFESLYFCFVAFSTIGFGDLVSSQRESYPAQEAYRLGNCLFILMGVCCIYSLFNVISIIIKQTLNWILAKLDCRDACHGAYMAGRRLSGEMISVNDFSASNKVSLAILQKQLSETAHGNPRQCHVRQNGFSGGVGAFAIMNNRLQETSIDR